MASVNQLAKTITCKIVYYGPGMCGKTSNLQFLHNHLTGEAQGELVSLATPGERTLYFDFLPVQMAQVDGFHVKFGLYTVPGQVMYNATRKLVLNGADGIVFVADSQWALMDENVESFENLQQNIAEYNLSLNDLPYVLQYNKRDLPDIAPSWYLNHVLNLYNVPAIEAVATEGTGVYESLSMISRFVIRSLVHRLRAGLL